MVKSVEHRSVEERTARGKAARAALPRATHAEWSPSRRTHKPLDLLAEQAQTRVRELVPIRHGQTAVSPRKAVCKRPIDDRARPASVVGLTSELNVLGWSKSWHAHRLVPACRCNLGQRNPSEAARFTAAEREDTPSFI
jgi:hypothetical protein